MNPGIWGLEHFLILKSNIDIYFFSGTGNTLLVARKIREKLFSSGYEVNLFPIEKSDPSSVNVNNTIGLGFPVAVQSTYPFVWDFIKNLPEGNSTEIFMFDTLAAFSGGIVGALKTFLLKKKYMPIGAEEIKMPSNFLTVSGNPEKNSKKVEKGLEAAEKYAEKLINNTAKWRRIPILCRILFYLGTNKSVWKGLSEKAALGISEDKCTKCGLCAVLCPVNNIEIKEGYPVFSKKCQLCMRCISFCPSGAILKSGKVVKSYKAVKASEFS
ncbi:MAG: EFR1 family ferrodoxin [Candidatus Aureabacteria bacterium]|nr:EFR1 family ferrodoxin [Candidatus Auribacterota bacterium]